jgi:hypothetical protein
MQAQELFEYGPHGYRGTGNGFFQRRHLNALAYEARYLDASVKDAVVDWLVDVMAMDNHGFNEDRFRKAVENGVNNPYPKFEQRHFYYLAHHIKELPDGPKKEYLAMWFGDTFKSYNRYFQKERWYEFCGVEAP